MREYVLAILKDHKGDPSSSRWIALLSFAALVGLIWIGVGSDPKQHKLVIDLANVLCWIIIGCVAAGQGASATDALAVGKVLAPPVVSPFVPSAAPGAPTSMPPTTPNPTTPPEPPRATP